MVIFLNVLKIIGLILAGLVALALLLIVLVLFVPIRYKADSCFEWDDKSFVAHAKVTYFLHALCVSFSFEDNKFKRVIRIFGIKFKKFNPDLNEELEDKDAKDGNVKDTNTSLTEDKKKNTNNKKNKEAKKNKDINKEANNSTEDKHNYYEQQSKEAVNSNNSKFTNDTEKENSKEVVDSAKSVDKAKAQESKLIIDEKNSGTGNIVTESIGIHKDKITTSDFAKEDADDKKSVFEKIKDVFTKFTDFVKSIPDKITSAVRNTEQLVNTVRLKIGRISDYYNFVSNNKNQKAFEAAWKEIKKILYSIRPRKVKGKVTFGSEDPSTVGSVLAVLALFSPIFKNSITVNPIFDETVVDGDLYIKGKITLFVLAVSFLKLMRNKDVKHLIKNYKELKNNDLEIQDDIASENVA